MLSGKAEKFARKSSQEVTIYVENLMQVVSALQQGLFFTLRDHSQV